MKNSKVMVWSVDPMDGETRPGTQSAASLVQMAKGARAELLPVYVRNPSLELSPAAIKAEIGRFLGEYGLPPKADFEILTSKKTSRESMVERLVSFAESKDAICIALSTHGRNVLGRIRFGSFAEKVLKSSPVPVLFLGRESAVLKKVKRTQRALFPTDFSEHSLEAFKRFLVHAKQLGLEIELFHFASLPAWNEGVDFSGGAMPAAYFEEMLRDAKQEGEAWLAEAVKAGVKARLQLKDGGVGIFSGELLLKYALESEAGLIVMASKSGPVDRLWLGSAAYETLRASPIPVWIYGPESLSKVPSGVLRPKVNKSREARRET